MKIFYLFPKNINFYSNFFCWGRGAWSTLQQAWLCHKTGLERRWNKEANGKSRGAEHLKMDSPLHICWGRIFPKYIYMYLRPLSWNFIIYDSEAAKILSWKSFWNINIEFTFLLIIVYFKTKYLQLKILSANAFHVDNSKFLKNQLTSPRCAYDSSNQ